MGISFKKHIETAEFINPSKVFTSDSIPFEVRIDPLTGQTARIYDLDYSPPQKPDISRLDGAQNENSCPFCPGLIEKVTPLFPERLIPGGKLRYGEAIIFPNIIPFDRHSGVCVISTGHYVPITNFTHEMLKNAFMACTFFIKSVADYDREVNFFNINWNYMPPAGSSIIHPHLQVNCGKFPTNQIRLQLESGLRYFHENGSVFFSDYVKAEKDCGERSIGDIGASFWTLSYAPQTVLPDFWCIFPGHEAFIGAGDGVIEDFIKGLISAINFFSAEGLYSFNVAMFIVRNSHHFRVNARISPRTPLNPIGNSDYAYYQALHHEPCCLKPPEKERDKVLAFFSDSLKNSK